MITDYRATMSPYPGVSKGGGNATPRCRSWEQGDRVGGVFGTRVICPKGHRNARPGQARATSCGGSLARFVRNNRDVMRHSRGSGTSAARPSTKQETCDVNLEISIPRPRVKEHGARHLLPPRHHQRLTNSRLVRVTRRGGPTTQNLVPSAPSAPRPHRSHTDRFANFIR